MHDTRHPDTPPIQPPAGNVFRRIARSFYFAFAGLSYLFRTQRNARIHLFIGACAFAVAWWVGISRAEWGVLVLTSCCVIILEGLNLSDVPAGKYELICLPLRLRSDKGDGAPARVVLRK